MSAVFGIIVAVVALLATAFNQEWSTRASARLSAIASVSISLVEMWVKTNKAAVAWNSSTPIPLGAPLTSVASSSAVVRYQQPHPPLDPDDDFPPRSWNMRDRKPWQE
jgi:hypothetical protein